MREVTLSGFMEWRETARRLLKEGLPPQRVNLQPAGEASQGMLAGFEPVEPVVEADLQDSARSRNGATRVPREFLALAETAGMFRASSRWNLLYSLLWRLTHGEPRLLEDHADAEVHEARMMEKAVRRDIHKMHAFVRFRQGQDGVFTAWYSPQHLILREGAQFFVRRFGSMRWAILTRDECAYWDLSTLRFGPGVERDTDPPEDAVEDLWLAYYSSIFNPARVNLNAMRAELPVRHWATLPEARVIEQLIKDAPARVMEMASKQKTSAELFVPEGAPLPQLREAAKKCEGCELFEKATHVVFGEGTAQATIMLVGEQPGDQEDLAGTPFVGPAGRILDRALQEAGLERGQLYITNAVKHFYFEERGKRRIHKKPKGSHVAACRPWLEAEVERVKPRVIVCLGATAALALVGRDVRVMEDRGKLLESRFARHLVVTLHPSALLRAPEELFDTYLRYLVDDLRLAGQQRD